MVGLESIRCSNVVVFGKARKLEGGEGSKRPREILPSPKPVDKPPHPLKLSEVLDWTVSYSDPPCVWLVTLRAWYKLVDPSPAYLRTFAPIQRRIAFAAAAAEALRANWNLRLEDALAACARNTEVVPGDLLDPKFRVLVASNAAATELKRKDAEAAARGAGEDAAGAEKAGDEAEKASSATVAPLRYDERDVIADGAFIAQQLESLRVAGSLVPGSELTKPPVIDAFGNVLEETKKKEAAEAKVARKAAQRAAQRAAARERLAATRRGEGGGGGGGSSRPSRAVPSGPREPRLALPPTPDPVVPESFGATPALVAETLALWDFTQTHGAFLRIPPCPWPRFRRAFLADASLTKPSDNALIRDVCVALLRVGEGPVAGSSIGGGESAAAGSATRRATAQPLSAKTPTQMEDPDDLRMLDWSERVGATLGVYTAGAAAEAVGVLGPGPPTWPSEAIKTGAAAAAKALASCEEGAAVTATLRPAERVALAAGLCCVASDSEEMGEVMKLKTETTRAAHNMGQLPLAPRRVKPKPFDPTELPSDVGKAKAPDWAETLIEWVRDAADRGAYLRHRPIGRDETGRAYHILGGAAGAGMLFVQDPTPEERARREAGADSDDDDAEVSAKKPRLEGATSPPSLDDLPARTPDSKPREAAEARASRVAAEARASIKRGRKENDALGAASSMDVWPTKWGVFHVGPKMKSLKEWLDDDPRNPAFADERRLKSISALLMKTAAKVPPLPDASGDVKEEPKTAAAAADRLQGDVEMAAEPKPNAETKPAFDANGNDTKPFSDAFDVFGLRRDGYAALDAAGAPDAMARAPDARARAQARDDAATALCAVIRFVLSGSTKFWAQSTQWLRACLNLCAALPDALGTGADAPAPGDAAGDRLAVVVSRVLPPLEAMLRASGATAQEWLERREAWFTGLRGLDDFDLRVPPKKLMAVEDAERAVALAAAQAAEAIEWSTTESALASASSLSVARSARLLATLCSAVSPDPARLTSEQFLNATPPATHAATKACAPGKVVALVRKGMKLARERYLDTRVTPEGWIPLRELRPVERAVVRGVAYRAAVPAPPEWQGVGGTPPCVWVLLELLDPAMIMPGRRKAGEAPDAGPRLVSAPVYAGGEIADYIIDWEKYSNCLDRPWAKGARIQMLFEDLTAGADPTAYGALPPPPEPPKPPPETKPETERDATADAPAAAPEAGDARGDLSPGGPVNDAVPSSDTKASDATAPEKSAPDETAKQSVPPPETKVGILKGPNGAEYWLGRVSRVRGGDDPWENTQVLFDSDPDGEEPMWVCPWEIELAPAEYQTADDLSHDPYGKPKDDAEDDKRSAETQLKCDAGKAIAVRLGWPRGSRAAREEFQTWREAAMPHGGRPPRAPTFCHSELDLYKVLVEVLCDGGYELVTAEKNWKKVAKSLGKDLTTQTSASFALRTHYQRCLLDLENWLWANVDTLGPRPDAFDADANDGAAAAADAGAAATAVKSSPTTDAARSSDADAMDVDDASDAAEEDGYADSEDDKDDKEDKEDKETGEPEEEAEGDEAFDPDAESDEDDDADSDEDFEMK